MANNIIDAFPELKNLSIKGDDALSVLGTPVFSDLKLRDEETNTELYVDTVVFDVSQTKNIVKTSLVGREGTVKEYISSGDFEINVKGVLSAVDYPLNAHNTLVKLMRLSNALQIESKLLNLTYQVYNVVVESYSIPQLEGKQNIVPFTIQLISDTPIPFINDDKTIG